MDCLFCKIIKGEIPSYTIYEDDLVKVFLDIHPCTNGHMLIIPKEHYVNINDIDLEVLKHINNIAKEMYKLLENKLNVDGITIVQNNGSAQEIKHFHTHIIPRYINDGIKHNYPGAKLPVEDIYKKLTN
ncbi:MAG: HIT domain-containing protein [Bacilli bacterium]|nr:HIT domain-containing protein [Bacilli bacterium]